MDKVEERLNFDVSLLKGELLPYGLHLVLPIGINYYIDEWGW